MLFSTLFRLARIGMEYSMMRHTVVKLARIGMEYTMVIYTLFKLARNRYGVQYDKDI